MKQHGNKSTFERPEQDSAVMQPSAVVPTHALRRKAGVLNPKPLPKPPADAIMVYFCVLPLE
jgi:hypothetical protein